VASPRDAQRRIKREEAEKRNELSRKTRPMQEEYARLERELEALFVEQHEVEGKLADPEVYADTSRSNDLLRRFAETKDRSEGIVARMSALEAELAHVKSAGESA
jgi:ATP-binding cassette subfamily F protein 3